MVVLPSRTKISHIFWAKPGSVNASLPTQNKYVRVRSGSFSFSYFLYCAKNPFYYYVIAGRENRRKNGGDTGNRKARKTHIRPEPFKPPSQCSKIFCGRPHQSLHMPSLPNSWARLSTSNKATYAADSIDDSRSTTDLTSRAGSYILQCS
jgi:hypothetical protein